MPSLPLIGAHFVRAHWRWTMLRGSALAAHQTRRAQAMVRFAAQRAPFYRDHWAGHALDGWASLPPVDKRLMMAHFDRFNTAGIGRDEAMALALDAERRGDGRAMLRGYVVGLSSGTSGHRGLFLVSPWEQAAWAGTILARALHGPFQTVKRQRIAFFLRANSALYERTGGTLIRFRYFPLMMPLDEAVAALNGYQPDVIIGPPSLLAMLAQARAAGRLQVRPRRLISVAEVLEPQDRTALEGAFGVPVHQVYQCTEGLLAVSCQRGSLHIQEDLVVVQTEPVAGAGGEDGRVTPIVTDLWRTTQPLIRYRLNDVLQLDPAPCPCGSPYRVIRAIEGRCDDMCEFFTLDGVRRPFFPDTIRRAILLASPAIEEYQAFQQTPGSLRVHLAVRPEASFDAVAAAVRAELAETVGAFGCQAPGISVEPGLVPLPAGAKRRRVQRLYAGGWG